jgi:two-component system CheB/CheR fusion protein
VGHIVSNLVDDQDLVTDVQAVLKTLIPKEVTVQTRDAKSFIMRILPYRTLKSANALARLAVVVRDSSDAMTV